MAIESTNFFSFLKQTRSPIGLVDIYNLSEIYDSDQRDALDNLLLPPEGLDQIFGLAKEGVIKEDIRLIGGLNSPVIDSLGLFDEVKPRISFDLSTYVRIGASLGEPGKQSFVTDSQSANLITFQGGLAAKNIEFNYLNLNGEVRTTSVSTSRESLFNSLADSEGNYTEASYPGLLRVRRRGHYNTIKLNKKLFVQKTSIVESPGASINIPVYMKTGDADPSVTVLKAYATKNSPFAIPIKVDSTGSFKLRNTGNGAPNESYYFGFEVKRKKDGLVIKSSAYDGNNTEPRPDEVDEEFNLSGTPGAGQDCILYIYCTPSLITELELTRLGIKEDLGKDIGLVGFDNLKVLNIGNNSLQNIPVWLKVNYKTLESLRLSSNPYWNNGPVQYFDWQASTGKDGSGGGSAPILSAVQILAYSGYNSTDSGGGTDTTGKIKDYDGTLNNVIDGSQNEGATTDASRFVQIRHREIDGSTPVCGVTDANGFRVFSVLKTLELNSSFYLKNADFSKVFPALQNLQLGRGGDGAERVQGHLPRISRASGEKIVYNLNHQDNAGGPIKYVGLDLFYNNSTDADFIGRYSIAAWDTMRCGLGNGSTNAKGGICTDAGMITSGKISGSNDADGDDKYANAASGKAIEAWSGWLTNLQTLNLWRNDIALNIAEGNNMEWERLETVQYSYTGQYGTRRKVVYNAGVTGTNETASDILFATKLTSIKCYYGGWAGKLFSINKALNLTKFESGKIEWDPYTSAKGNKYILPDNFSYAVGDAEDPSVGNQLEDLRFQELWGAKSQSKDLEFREDDFIRMGKLKYLYFHGSGFFGVFPKLVTADKNSVSVKVYADSSRFYNINNLGHNKNTRLNTIAIRSGGIDRGGMLLPSYDTGTGTNSNLYNLQFYSSLYPTYPSAWFDVAKRGKPVFNALFGTSGASHVNPVKERTTVSGVTFNTKNVDGSSASGATQFLYPSTSAISLRNYVRVGDDVYTSATAADPIGKVLQVGDQPKARIIIDTEVNYSGQSLHFQRAGQDISSYFNNCTNLRYLYLQNCSLVGKIPQFKKNGGRAERIRLQNNLLTTYVTGTLSNITGATEGKQSRPAIRELNLSFNPLSLQTIKNIIYDAYELAKYFNNNFNSRFDINLKSTKADSTNGTFSNYTLEEIFTGGTDGVPGTPGTPGDPFATPPVPEVPGVPAIPPTQDPLLVKFNKLGPGNTYSKIQILLN